MYMLEKILALEFKGSRDYFQGPDIFNQTLSWLGTQKPEVKDIDFAFHRLANRQLKVVSGPLPDGIEPIAACAFTSDGIRARIHLIETDQAVMGRHPYPEDEIVNAMKMDLAARSCVLHGDVAYSDIEVWVAMTKALHYRVFPHLKGKWLFVRGRFPKYTHSSKADVRTLVIASSFNDKLTRSEAFIDGEKVGEIYFSIV
jgi:hypothetical protein